MSEKTLVQQTNEIITTELATEGTKRALLATTFKGLNEQTMKQALLEGMLRGFTFQDFLQKNVYAVPFSDSYSLITSVDHARKLGMRGGINGKSAPIYTENKDGGIVSCSVTVYKKDGHEGGYTATVYFNEYSTGRNLWKSKPRTMIAKVAEMHALRMACPEELQQLYVSEEMEQKEFDGDVIDIDVQEEVEAIKTIDELRAYATANAGKGAAVATMIANKKAELQSNENTQ